MTQDNIPKDFHERTNRLEEEGVSDDDLELVEVLENTLDEILEQGESDEEAEEDMDDALFSYDPLRDDATHSYNLHRGSAFACDIHPEGKLIASGGEDDRFKIIDFSSGNTLLDCDNYFQDSVIMVGFNHDGKYVSACDMLGHLGVWKIAPTGISCVFMETVGSLTPSSWAKWHPKSNILLIGGQSVWLYKIPSGQCKIVHEGTLDTDAGEYLPDGKRAVIGFEDGSVKVVDLATGGTVCKFGTESTELGNIFSVAAHPDNNLIAAGSMNAKLAVLKIQPPKTVGVLDCSDHVTPPNDGNEDGDIFSASVEAVVFISLEGFNALVVGTDYAIFVWDYSRLVLRHKIVVEEGVTRILWPDNSKYLYVGTRRGSVNVYNPVSGEQQPSLEGHKRGVMDIRVSQDKKHLVTAGDDGYIKVFDISGNTND